MSIINAQEEAAVTASASARGISGLNHAGVAASAFASFLPEAGAGGIKVC